MKNQGRSSLLSSQPARPPSLFFGATLQKDRIAAQRLFEKLREANIEVWFDIQELRGGDAWDDLIRKRIKACTFFIPLISPATDERTEGYFRREWELAVERSHDIAVDRPFILPVALADIPPEVARVPRKFLSIQWISLPDETQGDRLVERLEFLQRQRSHVSTRGEPTVRIVPVGLPVIAATFPHPQRRSPWRTGIAVAATIALAAAGWRWKRDRPPWRKPPHSEGHDRR